MLTIYYFLRYGFIDWCRNRHVVKGTGKEIKMVLAHFERFNWANNVELQDILNNQLDRFPEKQWVLTITPNPFDINSGKMILSDGLQEITLWI